MYCLNFYNVHIFKNLKRKLFNYQILKREISDVCESKIITLTKSKEYDKFKIYRNNVFNSIYENQILHGVKVHNVDSKGYGEIALYVTRKHSLFFLKYFLLIPEEQVNLKVLQINKKKEKISFQVLCKTKKSKYEITPQCEHFSKCGGCMFQHIDYNFEKQLKRNLLISLCEKYNINILYSSQNYLQDYHNFVTLNEKNEQDLIEISQIKSEYINDNMDNQDQDVPENTNILEERDINKNIIYDEENEKYEYKNNDDNIVDNEYNNITIQKENKNKNINEDQIYKIYQKEKNNEEKRNIYYAKLYNFIYSNDYNYRNKSSINFCVTDHLSIGFYKKNSYEICDINNCYIHDKYIQDIYTQIKNEVKEHFIKNNIYIFNKINNNGYLKSVDIKISDYNKEKQILINFIGYTLTNSQTKKNLIAIANNLALKNPSIKSVLYNEQKNKLKQNKKEILLYGENHIYHSYNNYIYKLGANTFFQPNQYLNQYIIMIISKIIEKYKINSSNTCLYDLFCGIGFYSIPLANLFDRVISIDYSIDNIKSLEENMNLNKIKNIRCIQIDLFNQHNLKQINLHIRRYIVNTVKEKKIDLYDKIKQNITLTFIQTNNENILVENIQKIQSPYSTLPGFIYEQLKNFNTNTLKENNDNIITEDIFKKLNVNNDEYINNNNNNNNTDMEYSNENDFIKFKQNEFVMPIPDLIIVNPPRKGCGKVFRRWIRGLCCKHIIYVSCNVHTQFKDISHLINLGYIIKDIIPLDTFPRTPHFETIVYLKLDSKKVHQSKEEILQFEMNEIKNKKKFKQE
ncbi:SAM dependent methyltransferase, putative [Plasmodium sp. gorilla clade G2]|uniref:SAM dependent methyltransferase, putative n=1 Tax=Plasmodium sp. gorilla clade G2 TaxID=880535 RepID=UPI000D20A9FF|nr:SAM dependent methyltransferase, putative [Plasmodium sp. gorilla clade G2]SOV17380.1 SAM dependent methyltransferase, putative [Plasmodium sp. gorilla clade G2]